MRQTIKNPETDLHKYNQLCFYKDAKAIQWRKDRFCSKWAGATGHPQTKPPNKKKNHKLGLTPFMKINSKWIIDVKLKTFRKHKENLWDMELGQEVLDLPQKYDL